MRELDQRDVLNISGGRPEILDYDVMLADISQAEQEQGYLAEMLQLSRSIRSEPRLVARFPADQIHMKTAMSSYLDFPTTSRIPGPIPQREPNWFEGDWWDSPPAAPAPEPTNLPVWDWPNPMFH
ncbi:MAG: hypothetical protein IPP88_15930 [Betaproteobacteria bacterium]|nr:hypothetical protein [Betaproteobacteria bacterium]